MHARRFQKEIPAHRELVATFPKGPHFRKLRKDAQPLNMAKFYATFEQWAEDGLDYKEEARIKDEILAAMGWGLYTRSHQEDGAEAPRSFNRAFEVAVENLDKVHEFASRDVDAAFEALNRG